MTSLKEQTRRREVYQSLASKAQVDPRHVAVGMRVLAEDERQDVPTPHVSDDLRDRALRVRSGLPARLEVAEVRTIAVLGSGL